MYLKTLVNHYHILLRNWITTNSRNINPALYTSFRKNNDVNNITAKYTEKDITQFGRSYYKIQTLLAKRHLQSKQTKHLFHKRK